MIQELEEATTKIKGRKMIPYNIVEEIVTDLQKETQELQDLIMETPTKSQTENTIKFLNMRVKDEKFSTFKLSKKRKLELIRQLKVAKDKLTKKDETLMLQLAELRMTTKKLALTTHKLNKLEQLFEKRSHRHTKVKSK